MIICTFDWTFVYTFFYVTHCTIWFNLVFFYHQRGIDKEWVQDKEIIVIVQIIELSILFNALASFHFNALQKQN